jgi:hypothetical protein
MKLSRGKMQKNTLEPKKLVARLKWWANAPDGGQELKVISDKTGIAYGTLAAWRRASALPRLNDLLPMCEQRGIDPVWLLFGEEAKAAAQKPMKSEEGGQLARSTGR